MWVGGMGEDRGGNRGESRVGEGKGRGLERGKSEDKVGRVWSGG